MTASRRRATEKPTKTRRRKHRMRPTPKWLQEQQDLDEVARKRCLMILSVLSGERSVTEVIMEAGISRQSYYDFETRALQAILRALVPGAGTDSSPTTAEKRVTELEQRLKQVESEKRRAERLLLLTRKVMRTGRVKRTRRQASPKRRSSTTRGSKPSAASKKMASSKPPEAPKPLETPLIPIPNGADAR
jgi:hypothetical protein